MTNILNSASCKLANSLELNGSAIDADRVGFSNIETEITEYLNSLINMGCIRAHIHFKKDGKTMFMNTPSDSMGQRKYIHIGVNPEKQKAARDQVFRESKRADIQRQLDILTGTMRDLNHQLRQLSRSYSRALDDARVLLSACDSQNEAPMET